jgi:hypothetical protein
MSAVVVFTARCPACAQPHDWRQHDANPTPAPEPLCTQTPAPTGPVGTSTTQGAVHREQ